MISLWLAGLDIEYPDAIRELIQSLSSSCPKLYALGLGMANNHREGRGYKPISLIQTFTRWASPRVRELRIASGWFEGGASYYFDRLKGSDLANGIHTLKLVDLGYARGDIAAGMCLPCFPNLKKFVVEGPSQSVGLIGMNSHLPLSTTFTPAAAATCSTWRFEDMDVTSKKATGDLSPVMSVMTASGWSPI